MTTIVIAYDVKDDKLKEIERLLNDVAMREVNWNGAQFGIERGEFTCIPDDESADAVKLLNKIEAIIFGY